MASLVVLLVSGTDCTFLSNGSLRFVGCVKSFPFSAGLLLSAHPTGLALIRSLRRTGDRGPPMPCIRLVLATATMSTNILIRDSLASLGFELLTVRTHSLTPT